MKNQKGFTLIELLVVISVIGLLASVMMALFNIARERSKLGKAKKDIQTLSTAMLAYKGDVGELPPRGDLCSSCNDPPNSSWTAVIDALTANDGANWQGPYLGGRIDFDPWGRYYGYDDNDVNSNCGDSYIYTVGTNGLAGGGDDYYLTIAPTPLAGCY